MRLVGKGLQHADLENAAVPPGLRGCCLQPLEQAQYSGDLGGTPAIGAVLGENEPRQRQVLVLAEVLRLVVDGDPSLDRPARCRRQVPGCDLHSGPHRRDGADVGVEAGPVELLGLVEQTQCGIAVATGGSHQRHGHEPPVRGSR